MALARLRAATSADRKTCARWSQRPRPAITLGNDEQQTQDDEELAPDGMKLGFYDFHCAVDAALKGIRSAAEYVSDTASEAELKARDAIRELADQMLHELQGTPALNAGLRAAFRAFGKDPDDPTSVAVLRRSL